MELSPDPKPARAKRKRHGIMRRWVLRVVVYLSLLLLITAVSLWYFGGPYAQHLITTKLQDIVSGHMNAQLHIGRVRYDYPYGVTVEGASLTTTDHDKPVTLASFKRFRLQLRELPYKKGPLQIERIDLEEPTVHIIRTEDGFIGEKNLVKSDEERNREGAPKLSEVFHLRHLQLIGARIQYEDTRPKSTTPPMVWQDLNIEVNSNPTGASHAFEFSGSTGKLATITSRGTLDLDSLVVALDQLTIETRLIANQKSTALPPEVQQILQRFGLAGRAKVDISGRMPLRDLKAGNAKLEFMIEDGQANYAGLPDALQDVDMGFTALYGSGEVNVKLDRLVVRSGTTAMSVLPFNVLYTIDTRRWTASPVRLAAAYFPTEATKPILDQPATLSLVAQPEQTGDIEEFAVRLDGTTLSLPNLGEDLKLAGRLMLNNDVVTIMPSTLDGLGGRTEFSGWFDRKSLYARAQFQATNLSLAAIKVLVEPKTEKELKGKLNGEVIVGIDHFNLDTLTGHGRARVTEGRFAKVPVLSGITKFIGIGQGLFVADDAYARFTLAHKTVKLQRVAVSTTAMRVRGEGDIGFDKKLDLKVYITGTGDWGKSLKSTGIPVISDVAGALAGGTQSVIRGVTSQFTSLKVTGTTDAPKITPDPAPVITEGIQRLFTTEEK